MKLKRYAIFAPILIFSGCVATTFPLKNGVTFDRYERDTVSCMAESTRQVPTNTQVNWGPYTGLYSVDTNTAIRAKTNEICLRDKGYQMISLPYCSGNVLPAAEARSRQPRDRNRVMRVSEKSCYVFAPDGSPFFFNPD